MIDLVRLGLAVDVVVLTDAVEVAEGCLPRPVVRQHLVVEVPLLRERHEPPAHLRLPKLRHVREEMVDDLAVKVPHQPVHRRVPRVDVHGVVHGVVHPGDVRITRHRLEVRVRRGEVREEVHVRDPVTDPEPAVRARPGAPRQRRLDHGGTNDVREEHPGRLFVVLPAHDLPRVEDVDPEHLHQHAGRDWDERPRLKSSPRL